MTSKFSVVPTRETSLVWTVTPSHVRAALIEVDSGKALRMIRRYERPRGEKMVWEFLDNLRHIPVILSLDSALAYTAIVPLAVRLQNDARKDRLEFQGAVREIVNRGNLETRPLAAKALGVEDLDAVLFDARVMNLKMDGVDIAGWPQLAGKKLTGTVHLMFTTRDLFEELHTLRHSRKELFITEDSKAAMAVLAHEGKPPFRMLYADPGRSEFVVLDPHHNPIFRKVPFAWSSPLSMLREEWKVSEPVARAILTDAEHGGLSAAAARLLDKMREQSRESFDRALQKSKFRGPVYLRGTDVLPFRLPYTHEGTEVRPYPFEEIWSTLGFEGVIDPSPENLALLLPHFEYYYHRGDPAHHRALTRQIHWIAT